MDDTINSLQAHTHTHLRNTRNVKKIAPTCGCLASGRGDIRWGFGGGGSGAELAGGQIACVGGAAFDVRGV